MDKLDELKLSKELMLPYKLMPINISIGSPSNTESLNFIFFSVNTYEFLNKSITINIINANNIDNVAIVAITSNRIV